MKKFTLIIAALAGLFLGCQKEEIFTPDNENAAPATSVTLTARIGDFDTKATINNEGKFLWESDDVISVLATDNKFYDFKLLSGAGQNKAEFMGLIPGGALPTTVAVYPAIASHGEANTVFSGDTLTLNLPAERTHVQGKATAPMVASFAQGAEEIKFMYVSGVIRFPVVSLPANATVVVTMNDKTVTGSFPVDITKLGESEIVAGTTASEVTIKYASDAPLANAEINLPVPPGVYDNFKLTILDGAGQTTFTKDYVSKSNVVKRASILVMREIGFADDGVGTEPDDTDYDAFKLGKMPISFWWTVPEYAHGYDDAKTRELYAEMAASGINVVLYNGEVNTSVEENKRIMDIVGELGMKFIGNVWGATIDEKFALIKEHLASSPTYIGEYFADEPGTHEFDGLGEAITEYLTEFPDEEAYINLFPMYTDAKRLGTQAANRTQVQMYEEHINQYLNKIPTKTLSYDYYGLLKNGTVGQDFYTNLDLVRSRTLVRRMPYWVITQAGLVPTINRMPTEKEERWTVWATLAGGSKGISYFCYWTPASGFDDYMIKHDGTKTDAYYWIKQLNADIQTIGNKLMYCHADGMILTAPKYYPLYDNNGAGRTNYGPIKKVSGSTSIACGCFRDARRSENGDNYKGYKALVVSQMPTRDADAYLTIDSSVSQVTITHIHTAQTLELTNTLNTTVGSIGVSFDGSKLTLEIPEGEAAFLEF